MRDPGGLASRDGVDAVILDITCRELVEDGKTVRVTKRELDLLSALAKSSGCAPYDFLIAALWDIELEPEDAFNTMKVHVSKLRSKIRAGGMNPLIVTVFGRGLRLTRPVLIKDAVPDLIVPNKYRAELESLLYSHPNRAAADRVLASLLGQ